MTSSISFRRCNLSDAAIKSHRAETLRTHTSLAQPRRVEKRGAGLCARTLTLQTPPCRRSRCQSETCAIKNRGGLPNDTFRCPVAANGTTPKLYGLHCAVNPQDYRTNPKFLRAARRRLRAARLRSSLSAVSRRNSHTVKRRPPASSRVTNNITKNKVRACITVPSFSRSI
jgi:hypothetical protein